MAFNVRLWSFNKKFNSTARPADNESVVYNCVVKDGTQIARPIIELDLGLVTDPSDYNYARIGYFDRYYFIDEWVFKDGLWTASMHTDVLATFKTQIGNASLYVLRASAESDGRVIDNLYPCKVNCSYDKDVLTYPYNDACYVVGCVSKTGGIGSITYYVLTQNNITDLVNALLTDVITTQNGFNTSDASFALQQSIVDPIQYIKSCVLIPYPATDLTTFPLPLNVEVFGWTFPNVTGLGLLVPRVEKTYTFTVKKHPDTNARGNYVNVAPYTKAVLSFPPFGTFDIDTTVICDATTITCTVILDPTTGDATLRVVANGIILNELKTQMGVPIQLSQVTRDYVGGAVSAVSGIAGAVGDFITGNVAGGISSIASGVGNAINSLAPREQSMGSNGTFASYRFAPELDFQFFRPVDDDNTHHGRPLCKMRQPKNIPGYLLIQDGDIGTVGFESENQQIQAMLEAGFYYE